MKINKPQDRLFASWGHIDRYHNKIIASSIVGKKILDIGCGYGSLVNYLTQLHYDVRGIDKDKKVIEIGKKIFNKNHLDISTRSLNSFPPNSLDTIILKDCFHHIVEDGDSDHIFNDLKRIIKSRGRLIIFDPNPTLLIKFGRKILNNKCTYFYPEETARIIKENDFKPKKEQYYETVGILLSGGYIGMDFIPNLRILKELLLLVDKLSLTVIKFFHLDRLMCWRYIIVSTPMKN